MINQNRKLLGEEMRKKQQLILIDYKELINKSTFLPNTARKKNV